MKKIILHRGLPILIAIVSYLLSITCIFKIPSSNGGYEPITYIVGFGIALFALGVSAIVSAILYIGSKKNK